MVSDDMLSQDEIEALLRGQDDFNAGNEEDAPLRTEDYLSAMEQDALGEIGNISFGSSATALSTLLNQKVEITTPTVSLIEKSRLAVEFPHPYVAIQVEYTEGFLGSNVLVIKQHDAAIIADLMLGGDGLNPNDLLGEIQLSAVQESMNQMMGSAATSMSTIFSKKVDISPPTLELLDVLKGEGEHAIPDEDLLVKVSFRLRVGELIDSNIMQLLPLHFAKSLVNDLMHGSNESSPPPSAPAPRQESQTMQQASAAIAPEPVYEQPSAQYSQPYAGQPVAAQMSSEPQHFGTNMTVPNQQVNVQPASFASFQPIQLQDSESKNLNMLMDIPLQVTVELGRTKRSVKEILELSSGSIIELDKLAGEPVDILVNNRLIAKGEVVVIDENFGVRVTDIMSQSDRLKKLR